MSIVKLTKKDVEVFQRLRIQSLTESPEAYLASLQEEESLSTKQIEERICSDAEPPEHFVYGAFINSQLVGTCGLKRESLTKMRHKGILWGVYISGEGRGKGIGKNIVGTVLEEAKAVDGLGQINIKVSGQGAKQFYIKMGFMEFGFERRGIKVGNAYYDLTHMVFYL